MSRRTSRPCPLTNTLLLQAAYRDWARDYSGESWLEAAGFSHGTPFESAVREARILRAASVYRRDAAGRVLALHRIPAVVAMVARRPVRFIDYEEHNPSFQGSHILGLLQPFRGSPVRCRVRRRGFRAPARPAPGRKCRSAAPGSARHGTGFIAACSSARLRS
jgi:hypothetical protein